jgi:hypothetical protein
MSFPRNVPRMENAEEAVVEIELPTITSFNVSFWFRLLKLKLKLKLTLRLLMRVRFPELNCNNMIM